MARTMAFAGSFDPMTLGHAWVVERALTLADEVVVVVAVNSAKQCWFSPSARVGIIEAIARERGWGDRVRTIAVTGQYVAPTMKRMGIDHMVRGLRSATDFDQERLLMRVNDEVLHGAQTWFVAPPPDLESVSSSFVKGLIGPVGWPHFIKTFLPHASHRAVVRRVLFQRWLRALNADTPARWIGEAWLNGPLESIDDPLVNAFVRLMTAYESPERAHHGTDHIASMLAELDGQSLVHPDGQGSVQVLSTFFHDAVNRLQPGPMHWGWDVWPVDVPTVDEPLSAALIAHLLPDLPTVLHDQAVVAVQATGHLDQVVHAKTSASDDVVGADLAVLGQPSPIYKAYALNVRREYADVPWTVYREKRQGVLTRLIQQAESHQLFPVGAWADRYQDCAVTNMRDERAALKIARRERGWCEAFKGSPV